MATIKRFEDIEAWQRTRVLANGIFELCQEGTFRTDYRLRDQINAASGSIMDNIAEGFERDGRKEFVQFLSYAKGSAGEVRSQLYRARDRSHITEEQFNSLVKDVEEITRMISGLMKYLGASDYAGTKYK